MHELKLVGEFGRLLGSPHRCQHMCEGGETADFQGQAASETQVGTPEN